MRKQEPILTSEQCRMARTALHWTIAELAEKAGLATNTVLKFELGERQPRPTSLYGIQQVFEEAGIRFSNTADSASVTLLKGDA